MMVASWRNGWKNGRWGKVGSWVVALLGMLLFVYAGTGRPALGQESPLATPAPVAPPAQFVPVVLPSISGVISNESGEPLGGLMVTAYRRQQTNWIPARQTTTNGAGEYRFPWMVVGSYRLYIRDPLGVYASIYYPDAADIEAAPDIVMVGTSVVELDTAISVGGQISGTISWPDGPAPFDTTVELYNVLGAPMTTRLGSSDNLALAPEVRQYRLIASKSFTESVVNYGFTGLAAGRYRVCAETVALHESLHKCFDDAALGIHATDVVVASRRNCLKCRNRSRGWGRFIDAGGRCHPCR